VLNHVTLEIRHAELERSLAFWDLLGFERVTPPPTLRDRATWVERSGTQVHLLFVEDPVVPPAGHVAVVVEDFEDAIAALRRAGHEVEERPRHWGARRAFAVAPGGHRVELMASPPPASR
jgi:catechol 2,3-dioxygenase-like lactoylglutathione lyase family enzyme